METAVQEVTHWPNKEAQIFHHNDSDGLASGAILTKAFERAGFEVQRSCLEKPYPKLLHKIYDNTGGLIIFADFAGRIAPLLSDLNQSRNLTLILDHHVAEASTNHMVHNLDPDLYGLKGDRDISGSTTCYLFAKILDTSNCDLAHIAAVGAVGDQFFVHGVWPVKIVKPQPMRPNRKNWKYANMKPVSNTGYKLPRDPSTVLNSALIWTHWEPPVIIKMDRTWELRSVSRALPLNPMRC